MCTNLDENDGRADGEQTVEVDKSLVLVLVIRAVQVQLLNTLDRQLLMLEGDLVGLRGELGRIFVHVSREGSRKEHDLNISRQETE